MSIPSELSYLQSSVFNPCGLTVSQIYVEKESAEYSAYTFNLGDFKIKFRIAKITPTKIGQFVTFWKRIDRGPIAPFHIDDAIDFFLVHAKTENRSGLFIFPEKVLHQQGILSDNIKEGKRAIRVYPPWNKAENKQAIKTQTWQLHYFLDLLPLSTLDLERAKLLLDSKMEGEN
jgi:hypothetical protein